MRLLFAHVAQTCDLPPLPAVALRALELARDPAATAEDLTRVVSADPAIAVRVLRISRSAIYARRRPPRTLTEAIMAVGFDALRRILIAAATRSAYRLDDGVARGLWEHALAAALAADELAEQAGESRGGDAFIAGLLHDTGKLIFHLADPVTFARLGHDDQAAEIALFGAGHAAVGACLAEQWGLDAAIVEAIMFHHPGDASPLASRVAAADVIAHEIGVGSVESAPAPRPPGSGADYDAVCRSVAHALQTERTVFE